MGSVFLAAVFLTFSFATGSFANAAEGVTRELARQRAAEISELHYRLSFHLVPRAPSTTGTEEIRFTLRTAASPLLLDFREGAITSLSVNGVSIPARIENGHIELPASRLRTGSNIVGVEFTAPVGPAGKAITQYEDRDDHSEYLYTLFVPMDASMAFPCFDQPDLKARFHLELTAPEKWTVVSNTPVQSESSAAGGQRRTAFAETRPISTYLFAFAAGPFRKLEGTEGSPALYVRQSKFQSAQGEAPEVQRVTAQGIAYLSNFFAQPFPFPKYDMVLIPGFAYGGMEHAGATFLREESVLFRVAPTHTDRLNRDILVLHELTHQWFGDLVTMRWFDDLWLKEGFAEYLAYQSLAALKPDENVWKRFYEANKPAAYAIDSTRGTTPIYQDIPNLRDAKSAYGAIVYDKAPGVLKQLAFLLGPEHFRDGLRLYLKEHAYENAEWTDLVHAFERTSGKQLGPWADMWIHHRGMPQVDVAGSCDGDRLNRLSLSQKDVLGISDVWPISTEVLLDYGTREPVRLRAELTQRTKELPVTGEALPTIYICERSGFRLRAFSSRRAQPRGGDESYPRNAGCVPPLAAMGLAVGFGAAGRTRTARLRSPGNEAIAGRTRRIPDAEHSRAHDCSTPPLSIRRLTRRAITGIRNGCRRPDDESARPGASDRMVPRVCAAGRNTFWIGQSSRAAGRTTFAAGPRFAAAGPLEPRDGPDRCG